MSQIRTASTTLHGPWLNVARAAWIGMSGAAVATMMASTLISIGEPLPSCAPPAAGCGPWSVSREDIEVARQLGLSTSLIRLVYFAGIFIAKLGFIVVGTLIFWRKSNDWVALLLSLLLMLWTTEGVQNLGALNVVVNALYLVDVFIFYLLPFIFPTGRFEPGWMRWVIVPLIVVSLPFIGLPALGIPLHDRVFGLLLVCSFLPWFVAAGYAAIYRYTRISTSTERQQTKWVMAGILGTFITGFPFLIVATTFPPSQPSPERLSFVLLVTLPISMLSYLIVSGGIAFAILRYRLYDIDVIIRRTLVYSALTLLLAFVYLGSVVLLQQFARTLTGQQQSELVTVVSTLSIAALFVPLRRRIQATIDRRFFRRKYDAARVLAAFGATARDEVDLDTLTADLLSTVHETMQPSSASLWLNPIERNQSGT